MSNVITGSRAKVFVDGKLVGIFENCSVSNSTGTEAIHILGAYSPQEIAITSREAVNISCSGFRVAGNGKNVLPKVPRIQDLLTFTPFTLEIHDRQPDASGQPPVLETIVGCVPSSDNVSYSAKATSKISINYIGIRSSTEFGTETESADAATLV